LLFTLIFALVLSGCVLAMPKAMLPEKNRGEYSFLPGKYKDGKGNVVTVTKTEFSNTVVATPPDKKNALRITFEKLPSAEGRYIMQARHPDGDSVFLTVAEISGKNVIIHMFSNNLEEIRKLAAEKGITIGKDGTITEYKSAEGVYNFFSSLFDLNSKETVVLTKR